MAPSLGKYEDDIDQRTRWWSSYPATGFNERTKARDTLDDYLTDVFMQSRCLARSASATNLTYYRDCGARTDKPLIKSPSFSSLAPSHALPYDLRVPTRYIPSSQVYKTETSKWYNNAYAPSQFRETRDYGAKLVRDYRPETIVQGRTWYFPGLKDSTRFLRDNTSYMRGSMNYYNDCTSNRLRYNDMMLHYVYDSYDRRTDNRYLRYMKSQPGTFVGISVGLPAFRPSIHQYRMLRINRRVIY